MSRDPVDLAAIAAAALRRPVASAEIVRREPLAYDPFVGGRSVERVTGRAVVGGSSTDARVAWTAIVKRTRGKDLVAARREHWAYTQGIAGSSGPGMAAPALLGSEDGDDGVALWLEEVHDEHGGAWPLERFATAAADIAAWDVADARCAGGGVVARARPGPSATGSRIAWTRRCSSCPSFARPRRRPLLPRRSTTRASGARRR